MKKFFFVFGVLFFSWLQAQIIWRDQLIFKTLVYEKQGEMRGYVLLYADEHNKLIALDAESGEQLETEYRLEGEEIFLNVQADRFLKKQVLFMGRKKEEAWQLEIYHLAGQTMALTGPPFKLPKETRRILALNYQNGSIYYLYETKSNNLLLERKHIQCTAVGLPTFSNETSELFYDSGIDRFLIEPNFTILPDGLDASKDIVLLVCKGQRAPAVVVARMANCETLPAHTIPKLPDRNVSLAPPRGTSFPTAIAHGSRRKGYDICLIGHRQDEMQIYMRRMDENDQEIDEPEIIPVIGGPLYWKPHWIRGAWWFPVKKNGGVNMVYYSEVQGGMQLASNFMDVSELYLMPDPKDANLLYGLSPGSWRKYVLGYSLDDWQLYGGFRSAQVGKKTLCALPAPTAMGKQEKAGGAYVAAQVTGIPYKNTVFGLSPLETLQVQEGPTQSKEYLYLTTRQSTPDFTVSRKYCLLHNPSYPTKSELNLSNHYEYKLCWEASYGSDKNILGFFVPYRGKDCLIVKAVNQLYTIDCEKEKKQRSLPLTFQGIKVPDGVQDIPWYQKDLQEIRHIEYLGNFKESTHYLITTRKNIYQAFADREGIFTLVEAVGITGPLQEVSFSSLSEDGSTLLCGGLTQLNRTFMATINLIPGNEEKSHTFSGITYQYVQSLSEQQLRKPTKMVAWGDHVYILTKKGEVELYEKQLGSYNFGGKIAVQDESVLDMELVRNTLCLMTNRKIYCLDLKKRTLGMGIQTHFDQNKVSSSWDFTAVPVKLTKHNNIFFVHFPRKLECVSIQEGAPLSYNLLINSDEIIQAGFQIVATQEDFFVGANKRVYKFSPKEIWDTKEKVPFQTITTNISQLFCNSGTREIYYLSQDGEVGAAKGSD